MAEAAIADIYQEHIRALPVADRRALLEMIEADLPDAQVSRTRSPRHSILELHGLGKEIWEGVNAQTYIDELRDEWSERSP